MLTRDVPPSASALMSSLRGVGYSLETAIADIIDNSIAAGAGLIEIEFTWDEKDPVITILDDGSGMSEAQLLEAMRFGGAGPTAVRSSEGPRPFWARIENCLAVSVPAAYRSLEDLSSLAAFTWDVDHIIEGDGGWHLLEGKRTLPKGALKLSPVPTEWNARDVAKSGFWQT